jgi:hypothetical protein
LTPLATSRPVADLRNRVMRVTVVALLAASFCIGLEIAASNPTISGAFLDFLAVSFLILCPICAKGSGYRAIIPLGMVTSIAAIMDLWFRVGTPGSLSWFDNAGWVAIQLTLVLLASGTYKSNIRLNGVLKTRSAH